MPNRPKQIKRSPPDEAADRAKPFNDEASSAKQKNGTNSAAAAMDDQTNPTETKQNICKASVDTQCGARATNRGVGRTGRPSSHRIGNGRAAGGDALEPPHHMHPPPSPGSRPKQPDLDPKH